MSEEFTNVLVRMSLEQKAVLQRAAAVYGRSLTAEINLRLKASLKAEALPPSYTAPSTATVLTTLHEPGAQTKGPADPLSEIDRAMLAIFRRLSVEKQLALLSLFN